MRNWTIIAALTAFTLAPISAVQAKTLEERDVGPWHLFALSNNTGSYAICDLQGPLNETTSLSFLAEHPAHKWFLTLSDETWHFQEGDLQRLTIAIDDGPAVAATARAFSETFLRIDMGDSFSAEPLRRGSQIVFRDTEGTPIGFDLSGAAAALDALQECAARHLNFGGS